MTGEELYLIYAEHMLVHNSTSVEMWHGLPESDREAWEAVAVHANCA